MGIQAFVLRGPFTPENMARFVALLREIDAADPSKHYELVAVDSNLTGIETAARLLKQVVPPVAGRVTQFGARPPDHKVWAEALSGILAQRGVACGPETACKMVAELFTEVAAAAGDRS